MSSSSRKLGFSFSLLFDILLCSLVVVVVFSFAMFTIVLGDTDVPSSGNGAPIPVGGVGAFDPSAELRSRAITQSKKRLSRALPQIDIGRYDSLSGIERTEGRATGGASS
jgi:hypothetical protein